jgi:4-phytase/acid phosphatase
LKKTAFWAAVITTLFVGVSDTPLGAQAKQDAAAHLKFVLVLTRHGVRSPTWTNERLDEFAHDPWPKWGVEPGELTPHGKLLMKQFGEYYRESFAERGLLSAQGCEDAGQAYIDADTDHRTVETGRSLAEGLFPGWTVEVHALEKGMQDPLFHTLGKATKADSQLGFFAVSGRVGGDATALLSLYQSPLEEMQQVLCGSPGDSCKVQKKKILLEVQPSLAPSSGDHLAEMKGPLNTAATLAENLQLEYLEGMPDDQVGWGRVNEAKLRRLMGLHAASSDLIQRAPYVARVQASNLLFRISQTLAQAGQGKAMEGAIGAAQQKVVFLVGHDTNISKLSLAEPPAKATIFLPACSGSENGAACDLSAFQRVVENTIDRQFVR